MHPTKPQIRAEAFSRRQAQSDKGELSRRICGKLAELPQYIAAETVLFYVDARSEVRTREFLPTARQLGKRIVVPYCVDRHLKLFRLDDLDELAVGHFGILEPKSELRTIEDRVVEPAELDMIVVPGVAFDRSGGRVGHGKGYYDKLLAAVGPDAAIVALAFECQLFERVPMESHDVSMHRVITEKSIYGANLEDRSGEVDR